MPSSDRDILPWGSTSSCQAQVTAVTGVQREADVHVQDVFKTTHRAFYDFTNVLDVTKNIRIVHSLKMF